MKTNNKQITPSQEEAIPLDSVSHEELEKKLPDEQFGLFVHGVIVDRSRRFIPPLRSQTEVVTYTVTDNVNMRFFIDDFNPSEYHEIGEVVSLPVYVKPYKKKNGDLSYNLCIKKESRFVVGERF